MAQPSLVQKPSEFGVTSQFVNDVQSSLSPSATYAGQGLVFVTVECRPLSNTGDKHPVLQRSYRRWWD
jgi:hypothetical protein